MLRELSARLHVALDIPVGPASLLAKKISPALRPAPPIVGPIASAGFRRICDHIRHVVLSAALRKLGLAGFPAYQPKMNDCRDGKKVVDKLEKF